MQMYESKLLFVNAGNDYQVIVKVSTNSMAVAAIAKTGCNYTYICVLFVQENDPCV